jgi:hypothetical protein
MASKSKTSHDIERVQDGHSQSEIEVKHGQSDAVFGEVFDDKGPNYRNVCDLWSPFPIVTIQS